MQKVTQFNVKERTSGTLFFTATRISATIKNRKRTILHSNFISEKIRKKKIQMSLASQQKRTENVAYTRSKSTLTNSSQLQTSLEFKPAFHVLI
jgi:hypothetical protein